MWRPRAKSAAAVVLVAVSSYLAFASIGWPSSQTQTGAQLPGLGTPAASPLRAATSLGEGVLAQPMAVAAADARLYVADAGLGQVLVFDASGALLERIGRHATGPLSQAAPNDLYYPIGVALDDHRKLYVADLAARRIVTFDADGESSEFRIQRPEPGAQNPAANVESGTRPFAPAGLFYRTGRLYIPDLERNVVDVVGLDGVPVGPSLGDPSGRGGASMLRYPNFVYVDDAGAAYVSDSNNDRVCLFNPDGTLERIYSLRQAGLLRSSTQALGPESRVAVDPSVPDRPLSSGVGFLPRGLALDEDGLLHVAGMLADRVAVFDGRGSLQFTYGEDEPGPGLLLPNGLAVAGGRTFVADRANARIAVYEGAR